LISDVFLKAVSPKMRAGLAINKLRVDAYTGPVALHRAFEDIAHAQFLGQYVGVGTGQSGGGKKYSLRKPRRNRPHQHGWAILNQLQLSTDRDSLAKALGLFEQALKLDPSNVDAMVGAALTERNDYLHSGMDEKPSQIAKIEDLLGKAIRIDPTNARAYVVRGMIYRVSKRSKTGAEAAQNKA
jgi:tetratricopeptide (TPR) repeat protein